MNILTVIEQYITELAKTIPVELFVFVGGIIEEIIAPIPSPLVNTVAGSIVEYQQKGFWYLFVLAVIGAVSKVIGGWFFYFLADKAEDIVVGKFGKLIGVNKHTIEILSKKLEKSNKETMILLVLRALPIMPTTPVSVVCGALKTNLKTFLWTTFVGSIIRNFVFLYFGYAGASSYHSSLQGIETVESWLQKILLVATFVFIALFTYYRKTGKTPQWLDKLITEGKQTPQNT